MPDADLCFTPAHTLVDLIATKALSPVELMTAVLDRVGALEPSLNAVAVRMDGSAMDAARDAERAVMDGKPRGPLHGIPVTIKDLSPVAGQRFARGSHIFAEAEATVDSPVVARLTQAGAIVIGKTTTSEFGWSGISRSPLTGITHNPWARGLNAGASSAGAGVAAAAGYGPLHQGSDGAGSIRMPAHFCGIFGLKPSFGRVPYAPVPNNDYSSHIGPMTRDVRDAALMLGVMAGPHPADHMSAEAAPAPYLDRLDAGIAGRRIAFSPDLGHARVDPEIADLAAAAVAVFAGDLGAEVEQVTPAWGPLGPDIIRFLWPAHFSQYVKYLPDFASRMDPALVACIREGAGLTVPSYQEHRERKLAYCMALGAWFADWDFLITPSVSVAAFPAERIRPADWPDHPWDWLAWAEFSYPFNWSGHPAASVPCGFTADGRPVGVQIVGRRHDDLGVLQAAAAFERARPWADRRPKLPFC